MSKCTAFFLCGLFMLSGNAASAAHTIQCMGAVCVNDTVHFTTLGESRTGTVLQITTNGGIKVEYWVRAVLGLKRFEEILDISYVSVGLQCLGTICKGKKVHLMLKNMDKKGEVKNIFANGRAEVELIIDGKKRIAWTEVSQLSEQLEGVYGYRVGDPIMFVAGKEKKVGTIVSLYRNGKLEIEYVENGGTTTIFRDIKTLTRV